MMSNHIKSEVVSIKKADWSEKQLQDYIANNPSVLGLGELKFAGRERLQPSGGKLDLLFEDEGQERRYAVEIQLGSPDESHITRVIEYWDLERKRFPEFDYCAVLVAEKAVGRRYFNVLSLLNGKIPFILIQVAALKLEGRDDFTLAFTEILADSGSEFSDKNSAPADRSYWAQGTTTETIEWVDDLFEIIREFAPDVTLGYKQSYVGLTLDESPCNFVVFTPKKGAVTAHVKIPRGEETADWDQRIKDAQIGQIAYDTRYNNYRLVLESRDEILDKDKRAFLSEIMKYAYDYRLGNL